MIQQFTEKGEVMHRMIPIAFLALLVALPLGAKEYEVCEQGNCVQSNAITSDNFGLDGRKFCPICKEHGLKSSVYMLGCQSTLMAAYAYWDENTTEVSYSDQYYETDAGNWDVIDGGHSVGLQMGAH